MENNLNALLKSNAAAQNFFGSLPDYVQGGVMLHSSEIRNEDDLHRCADMIFHEFE